MVSSSDAPGGWLSDVLEGNRGIIYLLRTSPDPAVEYISDGVEDICGYPAHRFLADPALFTQVVCAADAGDPFAALAVEPGRYAQVELRWSHRDGNVTWLRHRSQGVVREDGSRVVRGVAFDISDLQDAQRELADSEQRFRLLAENASDVVFLGDTSAILRWASPSVREVHGWDPEEIVGKPVADLLHPDDLPAMLAASGTVNAGRRAEYEGRWRCKDGSYRWMAISLRPVTDAAGHVTGRVASARDIEVERRTRLDLARSEERFRTALESAPAGMAVLATDRTFLEVNPALCRLLGRDEAWLTSHRIDDVLDPPDDDLDLQMRTELLASGQRSLTREHPMVRSDGQRVWVEHSIGVVRDTAGTVTSFVSQFVDVTESRRARQRLRFLASHDPLTELMNRREIQGRIEALLAEAPEGPQPAVLFIDLDGLKPLNDRYGHVVGDEVIRAVAGRIRSHVGTSDLVARYGGDEFIAVLPAVDSIDTAVDVAGQLHAAVKEPIGVAGHSIPVTLSIGVALAASDDTTDSLLSRADAALYRAKSEGRDRTVCAPLA